MVVEIVLSEVGLKLCRPSRNGPSFPGGHRREGAAVVKKQHLSRFEQAPKVVAVFGLKRAINFGCRATGL